MGESNEGQETENRSEIITDHVFDQIKSLELRIKKLEFLAGVKDGSATCN